MFPRCCLKSLTVMDFRPGLGPGVAAATAARVRHSNWWTIDAIRNRPADRE